MRNDMPFDLPDCKGNDAKPHNKAWFAVAVDLLDHEVVGAYVAAPAPDDKSRPAWTPMHAWIWMLAKAAYKTKEKTVGGKLVTLQRGQLALAGRMLAEKANWTHKSARSFLDRLENHYMVKLSTPQRKGQLALDLNGNQLGTPQGTPCTIVTICNYDKYQTAPVARGTPPGTDRAQQPQVTRVIDRYSNPTTVQNPPLSPKGGNGTTDWKQVLNPTDGFGSHEFQIDQDGRITLLNGTYAEYLDLYGGNERRLRLGLDSISVEKTGQPILKQIRRGLAFDLKKKHDSAENSSRNYQEAVKANPKNNGKPPETDGQRILRRQEEYTRKQEKLRQERLQAQGA